MYSEVWDDERERRTARFEEKILEFEVTKNQQFDNRFNFSCPWCSTDCKEYILTALYDGRTQVFLKSTPVLHDYSVIGIEQSDDGFLQYLVTSHSYSASYLASRKFLDSSRMDAFVISNSDFSEAFIIPLYSDGDGVDPYAVEQFAEIVAGYGFKQCIRISEAASPMLYKYLSDVMVSYSIEKLVPAGTTVPDSSVVASPILFRVQWSYDWDCDVIDVNAMDLSKSEYVLRPSLLDAAVLTANSNIRQGTCSCFKSCGQVYIILPDNRRTAPNWQHGAPLGLGILGIFDYEFRSGELRHNYDSYVRGDSADWSIVRTEKSTKSKDAYTGDQQSSSGNEGLEALFGAASAMN